MPQPDLERLITLGDYVKNPVAPSLRQSRLVLFPITDPTVNFAS